MPEGRKEVCIPDSSISDYKLLQNCVLAQDYSSQKLMNKNYRVAVDIEMNNSYSRGGPADRAEELQTKITRLQRATEKGEGRKGRGSGGGTLPTEDRHHHRP